MAITVICPCGNVMAAAEEHAGRRVRCPGCKQAVTVPPGDDDGPAAVAPPRPAPAEATAVAAVAADDRPLVRVSIVDIEVSWFNLAAFLVKLVSASFPAAFVAYLFYVLSWAILASLLDRR